MQDEYDHVVSSAKAELDKNEAMTKLKKDALIAQYKISRVDWTNKQREQVYEELYRDDGLRYDNYEAPANQKLILSKLPSMLTNEENMCTIMPNLIVRDIQKMYEDQ